MSARARAILARTAAAIARREKLIAGVADDGALLAVALGSARRRRERTWR